MDFRILGPFEAIDDAGPVQLTGGKQKALLARLLLDAGRVVPVDRLVDDLWGDDVPDTATKMVQILVSQLRKLLPAELLRTRVPGYMVELEGHSLDLGRFEQLHAGGREALAAGRPGDALAPLREALELWRGPALAEFEEPFARLEEGRLAEQHVTCLEERIEAELMLGHHAELVAELSGLVHRHPLRERLRGQLMLALYRCGRQAEALEAYKSFRRMLDEELGIDPSPRLKVLERRMLQQDASLDPVSQQTAAAAHRPAAPLVAPFSGRERELDHLARLLMEAQSGTRRLVFLAGEAGIGKTTLAESLAAGAGSATQTMVAHGQCVEHLGPGEPYLPVLEALARLVRQPDGQQLIPLLARQAPTWLAQMPWLLSDEQLEAIQRRLIGATHPRMLREMLETVEAITRDATLVLILEDLHWSDPSTVELLDALARRREPARLLVLGTYRRGVQQENSVHRLVGNLRGRGLCTEVAIGPISQDAVGDHLSARLGSVASPELSAVLWERTGGNPLFVTTLLDSWLERGLLGAAGEPDLLQLSGDIPDTVLQLIEQMLDEIDLVDRDLLSTASAVGREFSAAAAAAAAGLPEDEVDLRCDGLARAGRLIEPTGEERWPDGTVAARYRFAHDLHREVLYARLPPGQRAQVHARVGERLAVAYRTHPREIAARLAEHFVQAGDAERAVASLRLAAEQAFERLAHREAHDHLTTALDMLEQLPDGPERWSEELALQSMLGAAEVAARGWSAVEAETAFLRTRDLAERLRGDELGPALFRLGTLYEVRGDYERSEALLEQTLERAGPAASSVLVADTHELLACSLFHQGVFGDALEHAEQGLAAFDGEYLNPVRAAYGINAGAACHSWAAMSLWALGYPDLARTRAEEAVALAEDPRRRHGYATALAQAATLEQCRLDVPATRRYAEAAVEAATRDGYPYRIAMARIMLGWALAAGGSHQRGIVELQGGLELSHDTGAHMDDPYYLALLADAHIRSGQIDEAWAAVEAGLALAPAGRRFFFESELHRTAGQVLVLQGRRDEAQERLHEALKLARSQGSPSLELRAAIGLAGQLQVDGQTDAARGLVAEVYATFTEGFDTHDLVAARELLEQLGS